MQSSNSPGQYSILENNVSKRVAWAVLEAAQHAGVSKARALDAANISSDLLQDVHGRLDRAQFVRLCLATQDLADDPAFALHWCEHTTLRLFDPLRSLVAHSENLGQALHALALYHELFINDVSLQLAELNQTVVLRCVSLEPLSERFHRVMVEASMSGLVRLVDRFCPGAVPTRACFDYPAPAYAEHYASVFGCSIQFSASFSGLVLDRRLLSSRLSLRDAWIYEALRGVADQRLAALNQSHPYALRACNALMRDGFLHRYKRPQVARMLGLTDRTLSRRLVREGWSFEQIVRVVFERAARCYLAVQRRSIPETASALGFRHKAAFHRAFKRWTGMTPKTYLRALPGLHMSGQSGVRDRSATRVFIE